MTYLVNFKEALGGSISPDFALNIKKNREKERLEKQRDRDYINELKYKLSK